MLEYTQCSASTLPDFMSFYNNDRYEIAVGRTQNCPELFWKQAIYLYILLTYKVAYAKFETKMPRLGHFQSS